MIIRCRSTCLFISLVVILFSAESVAAVEELHRQSPPAYSHQQLRTLHRALSDDSISTEILEGRLLYLLPIVFAPSDEESCRDQTDVIAISASEKEEISPRLTPTKFSLSAEDDPQLLNQTATAHNIVLHALTQFMVRENLVAFEIARRLRVQLTLQLLRAQADYSLLIDSLTTKQHMSSIEKCTTFLIALLSGNTPPGFRNIEDPFEDPLPSDPSDWNELHRAFAKLQHSAESMREKGYSDASSRRAQHHTLQYGYAARGRKDLISFLLDTARDSRDHKYDIPSQRIPACSNGVVFDYVFECIQFFRHALNMISGSLVNYYRSLCEEPQDSSPAIYEMQNSSSESGMAWVAEDLFALQSEYENELVRLNYLAQTCCSEKMVSKTIVDLFSNTLPPVLSLIQYAIRQFETLLDSSSAMRCEDDDEGGLRTSDARIYPANTIPQARRKSRKEEDHDFLRSACYQNRRALPVYRERITRGKIESCQLKQTYPNQAAISNLLRAISDARSNFYFELCKEDLPFRLFTAPSTIDPSLNGIGPVEDDKIEPFLQTIKSEESCTGLTVWNAFDRSFIRGNSLSGWQFDQTVNNFHKKLIPLLYLNTGRTNAAPFSGVRKQLLAKLWIRSVNTLSDQIYFSVERMSQITSPGDISSVLQNDLAGETLEGVYRLIVEEAAIGGKQSDSSDVALLNMKSDISSGLHALLYALNSHFNSSSTHWMQWVSWEDGPRSSEAWSTSLVAHFLQTHFFNPLSAKDTSLGVAIYDVVEGTRASVLVLLRRLRRIEQLLTQFRDGTFNFQESERDIQSSDLPGFSKNVSLNLASRIRSQLRRGSVNDETNKVNYVWTPLLNALLQRLDSTHLNLSKSEHELRELSSYLQRYKSMRIGDLPSGALGCLVSDLASSDFDFEGLSNFRKLMNAALGVPSKAQSTKNVSQSNYSGDHNRSVSPFVLDNAIPSDRLQNAQKYIRKLQVKHLSPYRRAIVRRRLRLGDLPNVEALSLRVTRALAGRLVSFSVAMRDVFTFLVEEGIWMSDKPRILTGKGVPCSARKTPQSHPRRFDTSIRLFNTLKGCNIRPEDVSAFHQY